MYIYHLDKCRHRAFGRPAKTLVPLFAITLSGGKNCSGCKDLYRKSTVTHRCFNKRISKSVPSRKGPKAHFKLQMSQQNLKFNHLSSDRSLVHMHCRCCLLTARSTTCCAIGATSGYNGGPGSVGGTTTYGAHGYDPYGQTQHAQHAYGTAAMQPQAPSSPYGRSAGGGYGGGGGFGSAMGAPPANPYATAAASVPSRSPVRHIFFFLLVRVV